MAIIEHSVDQITDPLVRELAMRGEIRSFAKNSLIINQGELGDSMYVIVSGRVEIFVSDAKGKEMVIDEYGCGEYFGEMALDGAPRSASVRAKGRVVCSVLNAATLREAIRDPDVALNLIFVLIERARAATSSVQSLALSDVYGRVRTLLLSLAQPGPGQVMIIPERITQQWIADRVGAHRDMISRICSQLIKGGYVAVTNRRYSILKALPQRF